MVSSPYIKGSFTDKALLSVHDTLSNQAAALQDMTIQYEIDMFSQINLAESLEILYETSHIKRGKVVVCGIGKSFKIANKLVATLNSLQIYASVLHPAEALHGDLGLIDESKDCLMFLTASGNTPELIQLLPHLSPDLPIILLTSNKESKLAQHPQVNSLLYAALSPTLNENSIHGIPAPTVSATLALVLADATILALAEIIEEDVNKRKRAFSTKHPGGSIGSDLSHLNDNLVRASVASSDKKSFSSQFSNASLLSLDQLRRDFQTTPLTTSSSRQDEKSSLSSLSYSDDEDGIEVTVDPKQNYPKFKKSGQDLSELIKAADPSQVLETSEDEVKSLASPSNELKLLQWTTMYDYIVFKEASSPTKFALSSTEIRRFYKIKLTNHFNANKVRVWSEFTKMVLQTAKPVRLD